MKIYVNNSTFNCIVVLVFAILTFVGLINHEMWRDELQAWLISYSSESLVSLFNNLSYECHPALWHLILYFISRFTDNPFYMQIFHAVLSILNIFIFVKYSTFSRLHKFLFAFGYYQLFEYNLICRNYSLGIFFVFTFCYLYKNRPNNYLILSFVLFLLSNTSLYGLIISLSLGLFLFYDTLKNKNYNSISILSILIFIIGIMVSFYQMLPPSDYAIDWGPRRDTVISLGVFWRGVVPLQFPKYNFWGGANNILDAISVNLTAIFSVLLFYINYKIFKHDRKVLISFFLGIYMMMFFICTFYYGSLRHYGHFYILIIAYLWLSYQNIKTNKVFYNTVTIMLILNFFAGMGPYYMDYKYPFSEAKNTAEYINNHNMQNMNLFGEKDYATVPVSAYLNININTINKKNNNRFTVWNKSRINPKVLTEKEILRNIDYDKKNTLVILNYKLHETNKLYCFKSFENSINESENYFLYLYINE